MAVHRKRSFINQAVHATSLRLCQAIDNDQMIACKAVKDYLFHSEEHQVMSTTICALNADLATFIEVFSNLSRLEYAHLLLTR